MPINQNRNNNNKTQIDTNYAHLQPQAVELEKVVLGALMIDTDAFSVVSLSLIHISEPTRLNGESRMPSSA